MKRLQPKLVYFVRKMANDGHGLFWTQWCFPFDCRRTDCNCRCCCCCGCRCRWWSWIPYLIVMARFNEHWSNRIHSMHSAGPWPISTQLLYFHLMWITDIKHLVRVRQWLWFSNQFSSIGANQKHGLLLYVCIHCDFVSPIIQFKLNLLESQLKQI